MARKRLKCRVKPKTKQIFCPHFCDYSLEITTAYDFLRVDGPGPLCPYRKNSEDCPRRK